MQGRDRDRDREIYAKKNEKVPTASGIPKRSTVQVLTRPNVA